MVLIAISPIEADPALLLTSTVIATTLTGYLYHLSGSGKLPEGLRAGADYLAGAGSSPMVGLTALVLAGALALGGTAVATSRGNGLPSEDEEIPGSQARVPSLVGKPLADARSALGRTGLALGAVTQEESQELGEGTVLDQSPEPGTEAVAGSVVDVVVAAAGGEQSTVEVPSVAGLTAEDASASLKAAGLVVGALSREPSEELEEGVVISQSPEAGSRAERGSAVDLILSSGPEGVVVPSLVGVSPEAAKQLLSRAGLSLGEVSQLQTNDVPEGTVVSQAPEAGAVVPGGTSVGVVVAEKISVD